MLAASRRTLASLTLAFALICLLATAAGAQAAIQLTSPLDGSYLNDTSPDVSYTGATPGATVQLTSNGGYIDDSIADSSGDGTISPSTPLASGPNDSRNIVVRDASNPDDFASAQVQFDTVPSLSGPDGQTVLPADATFDVFSAIPDEGVKLYVDGTPLTRAADANGDATNITTDLAPGPHTAFARSVDGNGDESSDSTSVSFTVMPDAPTFSELQDNAKLNQGAPALDLSGVDPSATKVTLYELDENGDPQPIGSSNGAATVTPDAPLADGYHYLALTQTVNGVETDPTTAAQSTDQRPHRHRRPDARGSRRPDD